MKGWLNAIPLHFIDENVRVGFGMDPDEKLNKANCLQPAKGNYKVEITNYKIAATSSGFLYFLLIVSNNNKHKQDEHY